MTATNRARAKAQRRDALLVAAATIMAERGFTGTRLEDVGAAVGISGPAVYRHFTSKEDLLLAVLVDGSQRLLDGGRAVIDSQPDPVRALRALVDFHVTFAFSDTDRIRVQARELAMLSDADRAEIARRQRDYVHCWYRALTRVRPDLDDTECKIRCRAAIGMINSAQYAVGRPTGEATRQLLPDLALDVLGIS